jgi:acid phosphatase (class A)
MRLFKVLFVLCAGLECLIFNPAFARAGEPMQSAADNGNLLGYLAPNALPDSLALLPPPPKTGSQAFALDEEVSRESLSLQGSPRWVLAAKKIAEGSRLHFSFCELWRRDPTWFF